MANVPDDKPKTKMLDELEKGPWPSFVKEIKQASQGSPVCDDLLGQLELSYEENQSHWKHGGMVGVLGYGGGVIGRYSDVGEKFPNVAHFHTLRVNHPAGWFYYQRRAAHDLRHLGAARLGPDQHARLDRRHHSAGHYDRASGAGLPGADPRRIRPGRIGFGGAHAVLLRGHGPLRVGLLRRHEALLRPHHGVPGRDSPPGLPLQVQDQVLGLPERLRGLDRALRHVGDRHLEGRASRSTRPKWQSMPPPA